MDVKICSQPGCYRSIRTKGMCASCYAGLWNKNNKEQYNENWRSYYKKNAQERRRYVKGKDLQKRYHITLDDYDRLLKDQKGVCAICGREERNKMSSDGMIRSLAVDHNHLTGEIRGLLCSSCNRGLGKFGDDPYRLQSAINYLNRSVKDGE